MECVWGFPFLSTKSIIDHNQYFRYHCVNIRACDMGSNHCAVHITLLMLRPLNLRCLVARERKVMNK